MISAAENGMIFVIIIILKSFKRFILSIKLPLNADIKLVLLIPESPLWVAWDKVNLFISSFLVNSFVLRSSLVTRLLSYNVIIFTPDNIKFFEISAPNYVFKLFIKE